MSTRTCGGIANHPVARGELRVALVLRAVAFDVREGETRHLGQTTEKVRERLLDIGMYDES